MKLNIVINKEVNNIIGNLARSMGTSKRNVISFALSSILSDGVTKEKTEELKEDIQLNYKTTVTVNDEFNERLNEVHRFGLSKARFYGYLICDYFYQQKDHECLKQEIESDEKSYVILRLDKKEKESLMEIAEAKSMTVNSLFIHYILGKDIELKFLNPEDDSTTIQINLTRHVKKVLEQKAKENNVTMQVYLKEIAEKIIKDY